MDKAASVRPAENKTGGEEEAPYVRVMSGGRRPPGMQYGGESGTREIKRGTQLEENVKFSFLDQIRQWSEVSFFVS